MHANVVQERILHPVHNNRDNTVGHRSVELDIDHDRQRNSGIIRPANLSVKHLSWLVLSVDSTQLSNSGTWRSLIIVLLISRCRYQHSVSCDC